ncbi:hypothetical protein [Clostridium peptidivorans]|uniref:hypothetical protein n=1 Tax=Clostridium peptidivorans TaxID=100174 RepID=UPI000BE462EA|nr:hypothetical protein [Clostridium peptidivorans]
MGLKESKKYAIGSIHENGGGKFEITDRWFDEETDTIMLKYKFLEGGKVEVNKEANVTASEWKWRKVRGLAGKASLVQTATIETGIIPKEEMEEKFTDLTERFDKGLKAIMENKSNILHLQESHDAQQKLLNEMMSVIKVQQKQIEALVNDRNIINKLLEKI